MISVIIPSRNRYNYVLNLLNDLENQKLLADEIIVIDQSDEPYAELPCIHIVDSGVGPCRARNLGLERCTGDIIVFLDDDIRINSDFIHYLADPILNDGKFVVVGAICDANGNYVNQDYVFWKKDVKSWLLAITANPDFPGNGLTLSFPAGCAAIHRSVYERVGGFDTFFDPNGAGEDREYGLRIFHAGYSIFYEGKAFVSHLGAPSGGRRNISTGFTYLNMLEANSVYIVAKYFGWSVFDDFCQAWLRSIIKKGENRNILQIGRNYRKWVEARKHCKSIQEIKKNNNW